MAVRMVHSSPQLETKKRIPCFVFVVIVIEVVFKVEEEGGGGT